MSSNRERSGKESIGSWVERYKRQIAAGGILLCLVIVMAVTLLGKGKGSVQAESGDPEAVPAAASSETGGSEANVTEASTGADLIADIEIPNKLEQDIHPEINTVMQTYYDCMAAGDVEGIRSVVDVLTEEEQNYVESLKTLIEGYQNLRCYTKRGMDEGTYLVFVRYDLKFVAADTMAPGIEAYYIKTNDSGNYYIFLDTPDQALLDFVNEMVQDEDVQALYQEVESEFETAKAADEKLAEYGMKLEELKSGGEEQPAEEEQPVEGEEQPAEGEEPTEGEEQPVEGEEQPAEEEQPQAPAGDGTDVNRETRFTDSTNIRSERSTESQRLALAYQGESVTQVTEYSDGWSKIIYNGQEGYCKTEYLE